MADGDFATDFAALAQSPEIETGGVNVVENPTPVQQAEIENEWMNWFDQPEVKSGLLQFGIQALQPLPVGQTTGGALAGAVGAGMEARDRAVIGEVASEERERKAGLEERKVRAKEVTAAKTGRVKASELLNRKKLTLLNKVETGGIESLSPGERDAFVGLTRDIDAINRRTREILSGGGAAPAAARQAPVAKQDPNEGRTATAPDGRKVVWRNGKWEPLS